ncbi:D-alanyl-D-alanine carboxypeptidase/D-alanyl-D-alanine-endopeptidase [uncultured Bacteroides sp.]|uniref:D-alanyl-D-alanine carboxypeptidase/D-alanyl-D-alanine endopeptidase n=1 Tax=uncultured Bacteroides sp. TaxID=162156 RepID=UPI002AA932C4|nr:D-alanyl-D-alanine carboxypeptidase/D-alanyl-D-alanine-endopeptidase [uncultured Bacteroides sp.]
MKKTCLLTWLVLFVCLPALWGQNEVAARIDQLLSGNLLVTSDVGISIYDLTDSVPLYVYRDQKMARPASTEKLITSITHLARLGMDCRFANSVAYTGSLDDDGVLHGDLYVHGGFDPEFMDNDMDELITQLKRRGLRRVKGKVYGDVSFMDSLYYGAGWCWDDAPYDFQPMLSPLMFHKGYVEVTAVPGVGSAPAKISVVPASSYYTVDNRTVPYGAGGEEFNVDRDWMHGANRLIFTGDVSRITKKTITVSGSAEFFMQVFLERAREQKMMMKRFGGFKAMPPEATALAEQGHTTADVLHRALKVSDNLSAEALFYHLGAWQKGADSCHVSAADGVKAIKEFIKELGYDPDSYEVHDGCGVSLYDYVTPELMLAYLKYAYQRPEIYKEIFDALPVAGVDGTLKNRMKRGRAFGNVRAKTGSVSGISTLAGYLHTANGHEVAFVIMNQNVMDAKKARTFQDEICELLCSMKTLR